MTKEELKRHTGLESWFELYEQIREAGHVDKEEVEFLNPQPIDVVNRSTYTRAMKHDTGAKIKVQEIKALAFDEIYTMLLTAKEKERILGELDGFSMYKLYHIFKNIPTRTQ